MTYERIFANLTGIFPNGTAAQGGLDFEGGQIRVLAVRRSHVAFSPSHFLLCTNKR